jgi:asparaginyl-tRNA synthetase
MINERIAHLLRIRAFLLKKARSWFDSNGYIEAQGPILVPSHAKSSNSFSVKCYDKNACLSEGFLPYGRSFADKFGKVYSITPSFRQEQPTNRHLSEYWRMEVVQRGELDEILDAQEELISFICSSLKELHETLGYFSRSLRDLEKVQRPFSRVTYDEAIEILQKDEFKIYWGQKIAHDLERHLSLNFEKPFFIVKYPYSNETLLSKTDPKNLELSLTADLLAPEGYDEIGSSVQMLTERDAVLELLKNANINLRNRIWFTSFMQPCSGCYSAFAIGIERLTQWICKIPNIKEATAFPRTKDSFYP